MKMHCRIRCLALGAIVAGLSVPLGAEEEEETPDSIRTIRLRQNDAQIRFESKVYDLKHITAEELLPFVNSAIQRYDRNSTVRRVTASSGGNGALLVSTGSDFLPRVDAIVAALDRPGKLDDSRTEIQGTGLSRIAYSPRYRAAAEFARIIDTTLGSSAGRAYVNAETNTIFWRDQSAAAERTLQWVQSLDRPLPQVRIRLNYYELRDSDLKDWGFDYLAWKNGPGVNLLNLGYNAGRLSIDEFLESASFLATSTWDMGGFFTAPQFDMSFIRCLQQSGNANAVADASLVMIHTPVADEAEFALLKEVQERHPDTAPFIHRVAMQPEYQNIAKNVLGRTFVGKSYYEDEDGNLYPDPPALEVKIVNPFICFSAAEGDRDSRGFLPETPEFYRRKAEIGDGGGVIFDYALYFKSVVERGNTGTELSNSALISGGVTLGFGKEKLLAVYEKENDVEQTIGLPILCRIPILRYCFSTVTTIQERTYLVVTAEAEMIHPDDAAPQPVSGSAAVERRPDNPFRSRSVPENADETQPQK